MNLKIVNNILKLKIIKIKFLLYYSYSNMIIYLYFNNFFFFFISYLNLIFKKNFLNINNSIKVNFFNYKKFTFFKLFNNINLNFLFIYNILTLNNFYLKKLTNFNKITNYDYKFLFIYYFYFIQNFKFGINKYSINLYQNNFFFIKFFLLKYINNLVNYENLYLKFNKNNLDILFEKTFYFILLKKIKYMKFLNDINLKNRVFLNLLFVFFYTKDVILFKNCLKNVLENLHFKTHRKFLYNLKLILKSLFYVFYFKFKCLGLYIKIKGKIGVGGNSKKRNFLYNMGSFSFTKKNQLLNYTKDSIRTYSGVLGLEIYLTYL